MLTIQLQLTEEQFEELAARVAQKLRLGKADTYSVKETAAILGLSEKTIHRRVEAKLYPKVPNVKRVRIPAAFIDKLVNPFPGT